MIASFAALLLVLLNSGGPETQPTTMPRMPLNMEYSFPEWEPRPVEPKPAVDASVLYCAEPVFDFGEVWSGTIIEHDFMVTNRSSYTVWVMPIAAAAISGLPPTAIGPHETAPVHLKLGTKGMKGEVTKSLRLKIVRTTSTRPAE